MFFFRIFEKLCCVVYRMFRCRVIFLWDCMIDNTAVTVRDQNGHLKDSGVS